MKLSYHYHTILFKENDQFWIAGYQGVFIDALAEVVEELHLIFHVQEGRSISSDYKLTANNLIVHNLGPKTSAWERFLKGPRNKAIVNDLKECSIDYYIFRSPSPLTVYFAKHFKTPNTFFYIVGDYEEGSKNYKGKGFRQWAVKKFTAHMGAKIKKAYCNRRLIVNSQALLDNLNAIAQDIALIKTTTLSAGLMQNRENTFEQDLVKVLYAGRFDWNKGHKELLQGFKSFLQENNKVKAELIMVGWEDDPLKPVENGIQVMAKELGIEKQLKILGRKAVGKELNAVYREADVYVLPSYNEGFPRTIWEAMGQGTPVIATKVGGIPNNLTHGQDAYLINPHSGGEVAKALQEVFSDQNLRKRIIKNGFTLAQSNTLEHQTQNIINHLKPIA
jgi:glycosyltransferase involved in cell wall biosynthesis